MANRKTKKKQRGTRLRPTSPASSQVTPEETAVVGAPTVAAAQVAPRVATSGIIAPRKAPAAGTQIDIDARVPYFTKDLQRIAITAGAMVLLIVGASFVIH
jgi:hypothetical protein